MLSPVTMIQLSMDGEMNSRSSQDNPSAHEQGLGLCKWRADWTARVLSFLIASHLVGSERKAGLKSGVNDPGGGLRDLLQSSETIRPKPTIKPTNIITTGRIETVSFPF
jgi:hypothetical protein